MVLARDVLIVVMDLADYLARELYAVIDGANDRRCPGEEAEGLRPGAGYG